MTTTRKIEVDDPIVRIWFREGTGFGKGSWGFEAPAGETVARLWRQMKNPHLMAGFTLGVATMGEVCELARWSHEHGYEVEVVS